MWQIAGNVSCTYRYDYVRKTPTSPLALVINRAQADVVRPIYEMCASGAIRSHRRFAHILLAASALLTSPLGGRPPNGSPLGPTHGDHNGTYTTHVSVTVTSDAGYQ
jgi:hypothetical protein